jgi:hypothetical protein
MGQETEACDGATTEDTGSPIRLGIGSAGKPMTDAIHNCFHTPENAGQVAHVPQRVRPQLRHAKNSWFCWKAKTQSWLLLGGVGGFGSLVVTITFFLSPAFPSKPRVRISGEKLTSMDQPTSAGCFQHRESENSIGYHYNWRVQRR